MLTILILAVLVGVVLVFFGKPWLGYGLISISLLIRAITMPQRELEAAAMGVLAILFIGIPIREWIAAKRKPETAKR